MKLTYALLKEKLETTFSLHVSTVVVIKYFPAKAGTISTPVTGLSCGAIGFASALWAIAFARAPNRDGGTPASSDAECPP